MYRVFAVTVFAFLATVSSQEAEKSAAAETAPEASNTTTVTCPLKGGGFDQKSAVAQILIQENRVHEAEACLLDGLAAVLPSLNLLSNIAAAKSQPSRAAVFSGLLERLNPSAEIIQLHATRLNANREFEQAAQRFQLLQKNNPENAGILNSLGVSLFNLGKFPESVEAFEQALKLDPALDAAKKNLDTVKAQATKAQGNTETVEGA